MGVNYELVETPVVEPPFVRSPYNYDADMVSYATGLECLDPSRAVQSLAEEADINTIVRNFGLTGKLPELVRLPEYGDFTGVSDYQSALSAVMAAEASFMELPAEVRAKFENSPQAFLVAANDPSKRDLFGELGLIDGYVKPGDPVPVVVSGSPEGAPSV